MLLVVATIVVGLAVPTSAMMLPPYSSVSGFAQYQSIDRSSFDSVNGSGTASALASVSPDATLENRSMAEGFAEFPGDFAGKLRAKAGLSGSKPEYGTANALYASSYVSTSSYWQAVSATLPIGTPVVLSLGLRFDGILSTGQWFGATANQVNASADSSASVYFGGFGDHRSGNVILDAVNGLTKYGDWDTYGSWITNEPSSNQRESIGTVDVPWTISGYVGDEIHVSLNLSSGVWAVGPYNVTASSDFFSTGYFTFNGFFDPATGDRVDVSLSGVPEPGSAAALGAMMVGLVPSYLRGRRRRF